eukprot:GHVP01035661.1.p1 GENE.GHVP01035661.1~~GHVP01035661.1.p1  ORF type:complete len:102 (+),score=9.74 GHVP01035661.1:2-307(+)
MFHKAIISHTQNTQKPVSRLLSVRRVMVTPALCERERIFWYFWDESTHFLSFNACLVDQKSRGRCSFDDSPLRLFPEKNVKLLRLLFLLRALDIFFGVAAT